MLDPLDMEEQLQLLAQDLLQPALSKQEYAALMEQLRVFFGPFRQDGARLEGRSLQRLRCMYRYVLAAAQGLESGDGVEAVLAAVKALVGQG